MCFCFQMMKRWSVGRWVSLAVMTYVYLVGELSHFLLGIVSRPMSQELHYGDHACLPNPNATHSSSDCRTYTNSSSWVVFVVVPSVCLTDYTVIIVVLLVYFIVI